MDMVVMMVVATRPQMPQHPTTTVLSLLELVTLYRSHARPPHPPHPHPFLPDQGETMMRPLFRHSGTLSGGLHRHLRHICQCTLL